MLSCFTRVVNVSHAMFDFNRRGRTSRMTTITFQFNRRGDSFCVEERGGGSIDPRSARPRIFPSYSRARYSFFSSGSNELFVRTKTQRSKLYLSNRIHISRLYHMFLSLIVSVYLVRCSEKCNNNFYFTTAPVELRPAQNQNSWLFYYFIFFCKYTQRKTIINTL